MLWCASRRRRLQRYAPFSPDDANDNAGFDRVVMDATPGSRLLKLGGAAVADAMGYTEPIKSEVGDGLMLY